MAAVFDIDGRTGPVAPGTTLFAAAAALGRTPASSCGQNGRCRECLLEVRAGEALLSPKGPAEAHLGAGYRLACCARVTGGSGPVVARSPSRGVLRIVAEAAGLPQAAEFTPLAPAVRREGRRILLDGVPVAEAAGPVLGAAVDVGTTTVVLRVYDLESQELVAGAALENPQRFAGSDVMARIAFDGQHGGRLLQRVLLNGLAAALADMPVPADCIYELVVAGNSTMRDLFFGLDVAPIGQKPYRSLTETAWRDGRADTTRVVTTAARLRLPLHPAARVYGLPLIGSHVGADAAACLLALDFDRREDLAVLMDIGTNTEVACGNRHQLFVASCPAGPAFEGGAVQCGMPSWDGAIERVRLNGSAWPDFAVIGGGTPRGICGSGLVDALSELRRTGRMDEFGRLEGGAARFPLVPDGSVFLSEADIGELAQAKGAHAAGLQILLKRQGVRLGQIGKFYLAGGFAQHLDVGAARAIGLIPGLPDERIAAVGNAAIEGAAIALLSVPRRVALESYVRSAVHVELETDPAFFDHFVDGCLFHPAAPVP